MTLSAPAAARTTGHPLAASLATVRGATGWLQVLDAVPGSGGAEGDLPPGWSRCADLLAAPGLLDDWVRETAQSLDDLEGEPPPPTTPAAYVMGWYLQGPTTVGALLLHHCRRVPDLAPADLVVHRSRFGYLDAVAVTGRRFRCLPDDPDAGHPDAVVVRTEQDLAHALRERVVEHARAFHAAFRPEVKFSSRQRWGMVHDLLDTALWDAGRSAHREAAGIRDAALVLDSPRPPLPEGTRVRQVDTPGGATWTRRRLSCCFMFALPSAQVCSTCPRLSG